MNFNTNEALPQPISASRLDAHFRLRKGTAIRAAKAGLLTATFRPGRGGPTCWVLPEDAIAWFRNGLRTE